MKHPFIIRAGLGELANWASRHRSRLSRFSRMELGALAGADTGPDCQNVCNLEQFARGILSHAKTTMFGQYGLSFLKLQQMISLT